MCRCAVALLCVWLAGCSTIDTLLTGGDRPTARVASTRLTDLSVDGVSLDFDIAIDNPLSVAVPLANLDYALGSAGRTIASGQATLDGTVPARGDRTVTIPASFTFSDALALVRSVRPGQMLPYSLDAGLSMDVPGLGPIALPLKTSGEVPVPAPPKVRLASIDWTRVALDEATAVMKLDVENPNAFGMDLTQLAYGLSLGERDVVRTDISAPAAFKAGSTGQVELPLSFRPMDLGLGVLDLLRGTSAPYRLGGTMSVNTPFGPLALPFDAAGQTKLLH